MKKTIAVIVLLGSLFVVVHAQNDENVLSYFAVNNSIDGQLMTDMRNVMRFFPVYAMQKQIDSVQITVYYGGNIYSRRADNQDNGKYWEALLPSFNLGQAIQRIEVEVHFKLSESYSLRLLSLEASIGEGRDEFNKYELKRNLESVKKGLEDRGISYLHLRLLRKAMQKGEKDYNQTRDKILKDLNGTPVDTSQMDAFFKGSLKIGPQSSEFKTKLFSILNGEQSFDTHGIDELVKQYLAIGGTIVEVESKKTLDQITSKQFNDALLRDSVKGDLAKEIGAGLSDTLYSGPSVRESDIQIDSSFLGARILYRNYKSSLRFMPALDPAERMGIFRARYVPFPIVGTYDSPRMNLKKPMTASSPTVFEIGLAFGDAIVPGDDFVVPEFSWRRLGVAFAITQQLFNDDAEIIGLALTYDFNSYGSIGAGGNFAHNQTHGYASLGINKKAFEAVLGQLAGLFK